jgi:O-antigen/teichoic acid export membrane protein
MWYKLTNNTHLGALLSLGGALVTVVLNFALIPIMSYVGSAWATLIVYFLMLVGSIAWGRKYYPVNYPIKRAVLYIGSVLILYLFTMRVLQLEGLVQIVVNICAILAFAALVYTLEKPKKIVHSKD